MRTCDMQKAIVLGGVVAFFSTAAPGQNDCHCWTPTADQIATVEAKIERQRMPLGKLDQYARYYAGVIGRRNDRRLIRGKLVPLGGDDAPGIHIVEGKMSPL